MRLPTWSPVLLSTLTPLLANALSLDVNSSGVYYPTDECREYH